MWTGPGSRAPAWRYSPCVLAQIAKGSGLAAPAMTAGSRRRPVATARVAIWAVAVHGLGVPVTPVARALGVTPMFLLRGLQRGRMLLEIRKLDLTALVRDKRLARLLPPGPHRPARSASRTGE